MYVFQGGSYTPDQIQDLFRGLGSDTAILLDGGGSSAIVLRRDTGGMWAGAGVPDGNCDTRQVLCDSRERALPSWLAFNWLRASAGPQCTRRGGHGLPRVPAAEEHDVSQQWIQLVQPDAVAPTVAQRPLCLIPVEHRVEIRAAEQRQHRQVGLAMTAVRRGVDQHDAAQASTSRSRSTGRRAAGPADRRRRNRRSHTALITASIASRAAASRRGAARSAIGASRSRA